MLCRIALGIQIVEQVPCFPLLGLPLSSTLIYTSELLLCSTICVPSATRHNIHDNIYLFYYGYFDNTTRFLWPFGLFNNTGLLLNTVSTVEEVARSLLEERSGVLIRLVRPFPDTEFFCVLRQNTLLSQCLSPCMNECRPI